MYFPAYLHSWQLVGCLYCRCISEQQNEASRLLTPLEPLSAHNNLYMKTMVFLTAQQSFFSCFLYR